MQTFFLILLTILLIIALIGVFFLYKKLSELQHAKKDDTNKDFFMMLQLVDHDCNTTTKQ